MLVVAVLGVIVALAAPSFLPMTQRSQLHGSAEALVGFAGRARMRAMAEHRCVKVRVVTATNHAGARTQLEMVRYNTFDCDDPGPLIDSSRPLYELVERLVLDHEPVTVELRRPGGGPLASQEATWRGSGWLLSPDATLTDDSIEVRLRHARLTAPSDFRSVLLDTHGPTCVRPMGASIAAGETCF